MTNDLFKRTGAEDFSKFLKVMISGPPKSGKTTLLGTVPNILVLDTEPHANNLESIAHLDVPYATISNSEDLRHIAMVLGNDSLRQQLAQGTYGIPDIGAVAIDTMDTLQKILKAERLVEQRSSQFLRDDWGWLKTEMEKIVEMFTSLPMHVFFVVHTKTKEMGKGDDAYTIVLPGLEGAISESIAGMVGYSLLSFRKEEVAPDGTLSTKYWLRTEGDSSHDFLGTRTAGRLPTIIKPDMRTIYDTVMANRPKTTAPGPLPQPTVAPAPTGEVAQNQGQPEGVQTGVQTPSPAPESAPVPPAEKPGDEEPITPAAMGHVKRVYDAVEVAFPREIVESLNMGEARKLVTFWRATQQDHSEGKGMPGVSPQGEMLEILSANGWLPEDGPGEPEPAPSPVTPKVNGTIAEVLAYVTKGGDGVDLDLVQEAYELESKKGESARATLIEKLEGFGAKPVSEAQAPTAEVQTTVESADTPAWEPVTPEETLADTPTTESEGAKAADREAARDAEAVKVVEEELGGVVVDEQAAPEPEPTCEVCQKPCDDLDLAELGKKRFGKLLCVSDYLAEIKK